MEKSKSVYNKVNAWFLFRLHKTRFETLNMIGNKVDQFIANLELNCIEETRMKNDKCSSIIDNKNTVLFQISFEA